MKKDNQALKIDLAGITSRFSMSSISKKVFYLSLIALYTVSLGYSSLPVLAASSCSASMTPSTSDPLNYANFNFTLTNTGDNISWIKITRPSSSYRITNVNQEGWDGSVSSNSIILSGSGLETGSNFSFSVRAFTFEVPTARENWQVEVSSNSEEPAPIQCSGSLSTKITPPAIFSDEGYSNLIVSDITESTAAVSWQTSSAATGIVYYGPLGSYSNYAQGGSLESVNHVIQLTGLSADTKYNFQIAGSSGIEYSVVSTQHSFTTKKSAVVSPNVPQQKQPQQKQPTNKDTIPPVPSDKTNPTITLETDVSALFRSATVLQGTASDNNVLKTVEYSLDGGQNWLPIATNIGLSDFAFEFVPAANSDGNYKLLLRATDASGNQAVTELSTLVIDALPPTVGTVLVSVGPLMLHPDTSRTMTVAADVDLTYTASVIGGATDVTVAVIAKDDRANEQLFSLDPTTNNSLWQGDVSITQPGSYFVEVRSIDGGKTKITKKAVDLIVQPSVTIIDSESADILENSKAVVFKLNPETNRWNLWDGGAYGQSSTDNESTQVGVYLPSGEYYLRAEARDYHSVNSATFTVDKPTIVTHMFELHRIRKIPLLLFDLTIPRFEISNPVIQFTTPNEDNASTFGVNQIPFFELESANGEIVKSSTFFGKPTIITFVNTWSNESVDLLRTLEEINSNDITIVAIFSGESASRVRSFKAISELSLVMIADPNNTLSEPFNTAGPATNYFVNRRGEVTQVVSGLLNKEEIVQNVSL